LALKRFRIGKTGMKREVGGRPNNLLARESDEDRQWRVSIHNSLIPLGC
jgi:hypothetical protein